jgi:hypothetical protein
MDGSEAVDLGQTVDLTDATESTLGHGPGAATGIPTRHRTADITELFNHRKAP